MYKSHTSHLGRRNKTADIADKHTDQDLAIDTISANSVPTLHLSEPATSKPLTVGGCQLDARLDQSASLLTLVHARAAHKDNWDLIRARLAQNHRVGGSRDAKEVMRNE